MELEKHRLGGVERGELVGDNRVVAPQRDVALRPRAGSGNIPSNQAATQPRSGINPFPAESSGVAPLSSFARSQRRHPVCNGRDCRTGRLRPGPPSVGSVTFETALPLEETNREKIPMSSTTEPMVNLGQLVSILRRYPMRWLLPAVTLTALAGWYAAVRSPTWEASQALIVRNEAIAGEEIPGKFRHAEEMQGVQETVLELVRSRGVLAAALEDVGPPPDLQREPARWPSSADVEGLRDCVSLTPPKGAEFGKTEVFYLTVRQNDRRRAVRLVDAIRRHLETRFQELRNTKARSTIDELLKAAQLARTDLSESTARLSQIERRVGGDLAELRVLHDASSGESALRRTTLEIHNELRVVETAQASNEQLLDLLRKARTDAHCLIATPSRLLESQPALERLKDGLVDAKLRTAELEGRMSASHPLVLAARESERTVARRLHEELASAIEGVDIDVELGRRQVTMLGERLASLTERLTRLAAMRAGYSTQVAETEHRIELLKRFEQKLSDARINQASAKSASLITRIDSPQAGTDPTGPSRAMIVLAGSCGGLLSGLGILLLTIPPVQPVRSGRETRPQRVGRASPVQVAVSPSPAPGRPADNATGRSQDTPTAQELSLKEALQRIVNNRASLN